MTTDTSDSTLALGQLGIRYLVVQTPDIGIQYFRDVAAVVNAGGPPDRAKLIGVTTRYGLVPAAPEAPLAQRSPQAEGGVT